MLLCFNLFYINNNILINFLSVLAIKIKQHSATILNNQRQTDKRSTKEDTFVELRYERNCCCQGQRELRLSSNIQLRFQLKKKKITQTSLYKTQFLGYTLHLQCQNIPSLIHVKNIIKKILPKQCQIIRLIEPLRNFCLNNLF